MIGGDPIPGLHEALVEWFEATTPKATRPSWGMRPAKHYLHGVKK